MGLWNHRGVARVLICIVFISSGVNQSQNWEATSEYMIEKLDAINYTSFGMYPILLSVAIALQVLGGVLVLLGIDKVGAVLLLMFMWPVTFIAHNPIQNGVLSRSALFEFTKNLAIIGGLMVLGGDHDGSRKKKKNH